MLEIFCPSLELLILIPGLLLSYLPMKQYLKIGLGKLASFMIPSVLLISLAGGAASFFLSIHTRFLLIIAASIMCIIYILTLNISLWKSASVYFATCGVFACLGSTATAIDTFLSPYNANLSLSLGGEVVYNILCWASVAAVSYPTSHAVRSFLEEEAFAQTWYVFWILPIMFVALNLFIVPINPGILNQGRLAEIYIVMSLALLLLLLLFYAMFFLMASSLNRNDRLRQENQFLSMQRSRYDNLKNAIDETREARHDMRHHLNTMQILAERHEWERLAEYLADAQKNVPDIALQLCNNTAVDSVASHYGLLCRKSQIPFSFKFDLPDKLPVSEIDFCLVLSNLLENALEASLRIAPEKRCIKVQSHLHSENMVLLTVENAFSGKIDEKNGVFQSSKRAGDGVGIQSVRRIADRNGGYSRFSYSTGSFCANIMLRSKREQKN